MSQRALPSIPEPDPASLPIWALRLRQIRRAHGLPQWRVARALGVSQNRISRWERGVGWPSPLLLYRCVRYFRVPLRAFCDPEPQRSSRLRQAGPYRDTA
jgi:transcriptional regulator with XRE-family HTH domain